MSHFKRFYLILLSGTLLALSLPNYSLAINQSSHFQELVDMTNFSRVYLGLCPRLNALQDDDYRRSLEQKMPEAKRAIVRKICTPQTDSLVKEFLVYLITINTFGSVDLKNSDYNLPGASIQTTGTYHDGDKQHSLSLLNKGVENYFLPKELGWAIYDDSYATLKNLADGTKITDRVNTIMQECGSYLNYKYRACNNLLNITEPDKNQGIFNPNNLSSVFLQQLHYNTVTNGNLIGSDNLKKVHFSIINPKIWTEVINPALEFGLNYDFGFESITEDNDQLKKVKNHLVPGGLGYLLDIIAQLTTDAAEGLHKGIQELFSKNAINISLFTDSNLKAVWGSFRNLVNICFVITFLIIIVSQLTNLGLSSYGVKKILPKLLVAIILVNVSFYLTQFVIDLSNIVGRSLYDLLVLKTPSSNLGFAQQYEVYKASAGKLSNIIDILLLIFTSILVWLSNIVNIIILNIRDAVAIIAVVTSPIGLIANMLPNSKRLYDLWWKILFNATTAFPVIGSLIGGGILIDQIIMSQSEVGFGQFIIAKLAMFGTMILIPFVLYSALTKINAEFKTGGDLLSKVPFLRNFGGTPIDFAKQTTATVGNMRIGKTHKANLEQRRLQKLAKKTGGFWAGASLEAQNKLIKQRKENIAHYSQTDAQVLISHLHQLSTGGPTVTSSDILPLPVSASAQREYNKQLKADPMSTKKHGSDNRKDLALSLAMSVAQDSQNEKQTDVYSILKAFEVAKMNNASQAELKQTFDTIIDDLEKKNDIRSIGILRANLEANNNQYGESDIKSLQRAETIPAAASSDHNIQNLHQLITQHTTKAFKQQSLLGTKSSQARPVAPDEQTGIIDNLTPTMIPTGTVANKVVIDAISTDDSIRDGFLYNYHRINKDTQDVLGADMQLIQQLQEKQPDLKEPKLKPDKQQNIQDKQDQIEQLKIQRRSQNNPYQINFIDRTIDSHQRIIDRIKANQDNYDHLALESLHQQAEQLKQRIVRGIRRSNDL